MFKFRDPKTTITGALLIVAGFLTLFLGLNIDSITTQDLLTPIILWLTGGGFLASKDNNVNKR